MQSLTFVEIHVNRSLMFMDCLGPEISLAFWIQENINILNIETQPTRELVAQIIVMHNRENPKPEFCGSLPPV